MLSPTNKHLVCEHARILRDGIRSGAIQCRCPYGQDSQRKHYADCSWVRAVDDIYRLERSV